MDVEDTDTVLSDKLVQVVEAGCAFYKNDVLNYKNHQKRTEGLLAMRETIKTFRNDLLDAGIDPDSSNHRCAVRLKEITRDIERGYLTHIAVQGNA